HARQDVVGRTVDDPDHATDPLARQRLAQGPDERDASADRGLEEKINAARSCRLEQLRADIGKKFLVGGADRLARLQRRQDKTPRRLDAAYHLNDHVDGRVADHSLSVVGEDAFGYRHLPLLGHAANRDRGELESNPAAGGYGFAVAKYQ